MKYAFIQAQRQCHSVVLLCASLNVSRSGFSAWLNRKPSRRQQTNNDVMKRIRQIHQRVNETYGSPRMHAELDHAGIKLSRSRVERLMRKAGIQARQSKRHRRTYQHRITQVAVANTLDRQFDAQKPNQKWVSDITFIETKQGWLYLAIVLDLYSRAIVGWSMSDKINGQLVRDAIQMAIEQRGITSSVLVHSDQGSQYTAASYQALLKNHGLTCSMSRKGECHDNAVAESFFHTLKNELVNDQ